MTRFNPLPFMIAIIAGCSAVISAEAGIETSSMNDDLAALEKKLFQCAYPAESPDRRLDRLERFTFGTMRSGSDQNRVTSLLLAIPTQNKVLSDTEAKSADSQSAWDVSKSDLESKFPLDTPAALPDYYPTVTALEDELLGQSHRSMPIGERLTVLESRAFGQQSMQTDLAKRVDALKEFAANQKNGSEDYLTEPQPTLTAKESSRSVNLTAQISQMEQEVFGKIYARDAIIGRVTRLEKAVFSKQPTQTFTPVSTRINRLMLALRQPKNLQPSPKPDSEIMESDRRKVSNGFQTADENSYGDGSHQLNRATEHQRQAQPSLLHKIGSAIGTIGAAAASAVSSMNMNSYYPSYGTPHGMGCGAVPGYGYGGYGGCSPYGMGTGLIYSGPPTYSFGSW